MKISEIVMIAFLCVSSPVMADSYTDAANAHIEATDMKAVFGITRDAVITNLENYKQKLLSAPRVSGNSEAVKLTNDYILKAKQLVNDTYAWDVVKGKYVEALKATYSEDELNNINAWLNTKYGKIFIKKQKDFMTRTIEVIGETAEDFKAKITPMEKEYISDVRSL